MTKATFLRLLDTPISEKGTHLRQQISGLNANLPTAEVFPANPNDFAAIPGSPFAYWVSKSVRDLFLTQPRFEQDGRVARVGDHPGDQERYLRLFWEIPAELRNTNRRWVPYQKGGAYSPYYADIHLVTDWDFERETYFDFHGRIGRSSEHPSNYQFFFRCGLTWPRRTNGFSVRILPKGCVFADKGPAAFVENDDSIELMALNAILNSTPFLQLLKIQLARTELAQSFEVGLVQQTPIPRLLKQFAVELNDFVLRAYEIARQPSLSNETTHVFCLPILLDDSSIQLAKRLRAISQSETKRQIALAALKAQIDNRVTELYGVPELAGANEKKIENVDQSTPSEGEEPVVDEEEDEDEITSLLSDPYSLVSDLVMWCVGVAFGRWDVRYALNPKSMSALPEPFDALPVCSPGMLQGKDGLPLDEAPKSYPLPIASRGFLVDDPDRPRDDITTAVRQVLSLLWGANSEAIENEACQILEVPDLRTWFRDPKGFFAWHIRRYSKSRRKAPIYWLIQSAKRNYAVWLYYPRLNPDSLFFAAREYTDAKLNLETTRLEDLQNNLNSFSGADRKIQEKKLATQTALVAELKSYLKALDAAALLQVKPDLNDGVLLNIASLRELVPWKEPTRIWEELLHGKYAWSHIATQLRQKGLVKSA
jgi:hypothetical protein